MKFMPVVAATIALLVGCDSGPSDPAGNQPSSGTTATLPPSARVAAELISAAAIREVVAEISSDDYAGRGPATAGDRAARAYLATVLGTAGFRPAAPGGGWEQPFALVGINASQPSSWTFSAADGEFALEQGAQFIAASGVQAEVARIQDAEVVFVGYGIQAPEYDWNDYKDVDLSGKVLLMLNNDPDWDPNLFAGDTRLYYGRWSYKYESAARQGAAGAIVIHSLESAGYPWQVVQTSWTGEQFELPAGDEPRLQVEAWITDTAATELLELAGFELPELVAAARAPDFVPVPLGVRTSIEMQTELSSVTTANVLGMLDGADSGLADEVVIYMAHHDHLGVAEPDPDNPPDSDRIFNGARDNGSGVGMVAAIAQAFGALDSPPRRSILVAYVGAEEQGLLGSQFLATQPVVPAGRMAAIINFDSGNIWGLTRDITFVGLGKSTLDAVAQTVSELQGRTVLPDQFPDRGYFYRSDQFSLAKIGVPGMYLRNGTDFVGRPSDWGAEQNSLYERDRYHQPSDELTADWDFSGMVQDARFGFFAGLLIADADAVPAWRPGDEFEAASLEALNALANQVE
jgi:Zn-dependent M28 family amino/carboxypeptidase